MQAGWHGYVGVVCVWWGDGVILLCIIVIINNNNSGVILFVTAAVSPAVRNGCLPFAVNGTSSYQSMVGARGGVLCVQDVICAVFCCRLCTNQQRPQPDKAACSSCFTAMCCAANSSCSGLVGVCGRTTVFRSAWSALLTRPSFVSSSICLMPTPASTVCGAIHLTCPLQHWCSRPFPLFVVLQASPVCPRVVLAMQQTISERPHSNFTRLALYQLSACVRLDAAEAFRPAAAMLLLSTLLCDLCGARSPTRNAPVCFMGLWWQRAHPQGTWCVCLFGFAPDVWFQGSHQVCGAPHMVVITRGGVRCRGSLSLWPQCRPLLSHMTPTCGLCFGCCCCRVDRQKCMVC